VAIVVSRKVHKSAVVRNRIRRRLYEIFREQAAYITEPYDLVLVVYSDHVATMDATELRAQVLKQLHGAGVLQAQPEHDRQQHGIVERKEL
jgi:ribonuclease P protein component